MNGCGALNDFGRDGGMLVERDLLSSAFFGILLKGRHLRRITLTSVGGKVLKNITATTAEREALRMSVEHLMIWFPFEAKYFQFVVEMRVETQSTK